MKLFVKQKVFTFRDRFAVWDENGEDKYYVQGELFTLGRRLHVYDVNNEEIIYIRQRIFTFLPKFRLYIKSLPVGEIIKQFTFIRHVYTIPNLGIEINGDFFAHEYSIMKNGEIIGSISKQWLTWGDTYVIDIASPADELIILTAMLSIDCCMANQNNG